MYIVHLFKFLAFMLSINIICTETINTNIVLKNVERSIDLTSQLVKIISKVTIENTGPGDFNNILWTTEHGSSEKLSYISATNSSKHELLVKETKVDGHADDKFYIIFNKNVEQKLILTIEEVYIGSVIPYPAAIAQNDNQLVRYFGNHYLYSPYVVQNQTTKVLIRSKNIENYDSKPFTVADGLIIYGPYENIQPFIVDNLTFHFENNSPFLIVKKLKREIEVSHWGSIAVEESISLFHAGAVLKGPFSRIDYEESRTDLYSIKSFKTVLPSSAEKPYYRDIVGNNSKSEMSIKKNCIELNLSPRFPLFGGWKTCYTLGYRVPSYQYLFQSKDSYVLKMRVLDHVYNDMHVEDLETTVMLPVGAKNVQLSTPYDMKILTDLVVYKYFDSIGRPLLKISKKNLVENHIQDFEISYQWSRLFIMNEPFWIALCCYVLFLLVIAYVRLDLSIYKTTEG